MPNNVFNFNQKINGAFRADKLEVKFGGKSVNGMLFQNIQFSFTQQITTLYEIGGEGNVYFVGGRAQGTASVARIIGPGQPLKTFISSYGDICDPKELEFEANGNSCGGKGGKGGGTVSYRLTGVVLTTVAVSVAAQDIVIHEQLQFLYVNLEVK